jgi:hypothetical protein
MPEVRPTPMVPRYAGFVTTLRTGWLPGGSRLVAGGRPRDRYFRPAFVRRLDAERQD